MKSKRAGVFIASLGLQSDRVLLRIRFDAPQSIPPSNEDLMKLVELAEADADADFKLEREQFRNECSALHAELDNVRERAVRAFCTSCEDSDLTKDMKGCYKPQRCKGFQKFLNTYDNGQ